MKAGSPATNIEFLGLFDKELDKQFRQWAADKARTLVDQFKRQYAEELQIELCRLISETAINIASYQTADSRYPTVQFQVCLPKEKK